MVPTTIACVHKCDYTRGREANARAQLALVSAIQQRDTRPQSWRVYLCDYSYDDGEDDDDVVGK